MSHFSIIPRRSLPGLAALLLTVIGYVAWTAARAETQARRPPPAVDLSMVPPARLTVDADRGEITVELPPVDVPSGEAAEMGEQPPPSIATLPVGGAIFAVHAEAVDAAGRRLPDALIHHFNLMDPSERELFLPIARRMAAVGKETGTVRFPWLLFGERFRAGSRVIASAMVHNTTPAVYRGVRVRLILNYTPDTRPWPLFPVAPWQLDVAFPVGDKSFDLPPGHSERAYEGSPAVAGDLVAVGGHVHEYGTSLELSDMTTGEVIWRGEPKREATGQAGPIPIAKLYGLTRIGARIVPEHRYRVRVVYDNPTGRTLRGGGMGVIAGLLVLDRHAVWPAVNPDDSLYQADLRHYLHLARGGIAPAHEHMHH